MHKEILHGYKMSKNNLGLEEYNFIWHEDSIYIWSRKYQGAKYIRDFLVWDRQGIFFNPSLKFAPTVWTWGVLLEPPNQLS